MRHPHQRGAARATPATSRRRRTAITATFARVLGNREIGSCRYYSPGQRFWIASRTRGRYADGSVICGAPEHPAHDAQATMNPTLVIEVLSPSSEGDDDGDKRSDFQSLASLEAYVLVAQDQRQVKVCTTSGAPKSTRARQRRARAMISGSTASTRSIS